MARVTASMPVNLSGNGSALNLSYDGLVTTRADTSGMSWRYTRYGLTVMDIAISGSFAISYYDISGTINGMYVSTPSNGSALTIDSFSVGFGTITDLSNAFSFDRILAAADSVSGSDGNDILTAHGGNDTVAGFGGNDSMSGGANEDDLNGNMGNDTLDGGSGYDTVVGGKDQDLVRGGEHADYVHGNMGSDTVYGDGGNDTVHGGRDQDLLFGGDGADFVSGDLGNDTLYGNAGADVFAILADGGADTIMDFNPAEGDLIRCAVGMGYSIADDGTDALVSFSGGASLRLHGMAGAMSGTWIVTG